MTYSSASTLNQYISDVVAVVIGRNEGQRLKICLQSLQQHLGSAIVYVDSGSTDGSAAYARSINVSVVDLDMSCPFTAARARNEGWRRALECYPGATYVQFIDGDCELNARWIGTSVEFLNQHLSAAVACGRRRERYPEASIYNQLCDIEWNTQIGIVAACGGDALIRVKALVQVAGFSEKLIAGEEPEMCIRLRSLNWEIHRIDAEMTLHDANMHHFSQWWTRAKRGGYAFAEGAMLHGTGPHRHWVVETRRALTWGAILPLTHMACLSLSWHFGAIQPSLWIPLIYLTQWFRLILISPARGPSKIIQSFFMLLIKFPEASGAILFYWRHILRQKQSLIEYK